MNARRMWRYGRRGYVKGAWSKPVEVAREKNIPTWNPVLFHTKDGRLWLYYKAGPDTGSWSGARMWSDG